MSDNNSNNSNIITTTPPPPTVAATNNDSFTTAIPNLPLSPINIQDIERENEDINNASIVTNTPRIALNFSINENENSIDLTFITANTSNTTLPLSSPTPSSPTQSPSIQSSPTPSSPTQSPSIQSSPSFNATDYGPFESTDFTTYSLENLSLGSHAVGFGSSQQPTRTIYVSVNKALEIFNQVGSITDTIDPLDYASYATAFATNSSTYHSNSSPLNSPPSSPNSPPQYTQDHHLFNTLTTQTKSIPSTALYSLLHGEIGALYSNLTVEANISLDLHKQWHHLVSTPRGPDQTIKSGLTSSSGRLKLIFETDLDDSYILFADRLTTYFLGSLFFMIPILILTLLLPLPLNIFIPPIIMAVLYAPDMVHLWNLSRYIRARTGPTFLPVTNLKWYHFIWLFRYIILDGPGVFFSNGLQTRLSGGEFSIYGRSLVAQESSSDPKSGSLSQLVLHRKARIDFSVRSYTIREPKLSLNPFAPPSKLPSFSFIRSLFTSTPLDPEDPLNTSSIALLSSYATKTSSISTSTSSSPPPSTTTTTTTTTSFPRSLEHQSNEFNSTLSSRKYLLISLYFILFWIIVYL